MRARSAGPSARVGRKRRGKSGGCGKGAAGAKGAKRKPVRVAKQVEHEEETYADPDVEELEEDELNEEVGHEGHEDDDEPEEEEQYDEPTEEPRGADSSRVASEQRWERPWRTADQAVCTGRSHCRFVTSEKASIALSRSRSAAKIFYVFRTPVRLGA